MDKIHFIKVMNNNTSDFNHFTAVFLKKMCTLEVLQPSQIIDQNLWPYFISVLALFTKM
jgi:hypothetical protein